MKKFVLVFHGKVREDISKEEINKWGAWFGTFKEQTIDGGSPLNPVAKAVTKDGVATIPADKLPALGYTIINAKDMDEAVKIAEGCPVIEDYEEGTVRIHETMPL